MPEHKKKLLFIANPISGAGKKFSLEKIISSYLDNTRYEGEVYYTKCRGDATRKVFEAKDTVDAVIAVGGDGTINEVAQGLIHSDTPLGIIPKGSGNGFANYFRIPLNPQEAILKINDFKLKTIDTGTFNDMLFLCVAGLGFDAEVAHAFDQSKTRGFFTYLWLTLKAYKHYRPRQYTIVHQGKSYKHKALLITAANSSQFGNNAFIAPKARIDDGLLDLVVLKPFGLQHIFKISYQLFSGSLHLSKFYECLRGKAFEIENTDEIAQIDGEPILSKPDNYIRVQANSMKMII